MKEQAADTVDQPLENVELKVSDLSMENGTAGRKVKQRPRGIKGINKASRWRALAPAGEVGGSVLPWPGVRTQIEKTDRRLGQGGGERSGAVAGQWDQGCR